MSRQAYGWEWDAFKGSPEGLNWVRRDVQNLDAVVARCRQTRVVVQAGSNLGIFPKRLAQTFGLVYTFEPDGDNFVASVLNAPEANIRRYQAALGSQHGLVGVSKIRRDRKPNSHEGVTHVSGSGDIPTFRIDDLNLPICDLVYLDTEGTEHDILKGAIDTLDRCRPLLAVEIDKNVSYAGITKQALRAFIETLGYLKVDRQRSDDVYEPVEWSPDALAG